jgi:CRP/FNR family cyclic AMP-dependent transcriptional regulator
MINNDPRHIEDAETFLTHGHRKRYGAKSTIIYAGDKADILYYVVKGTVSVLV